MPRITPLHYKRLIKVFELDGWSYNRTKGDHFIYTKPGYKRDVVIPMEKDVAVHIIHSNMRTAKMSRERYFELLDKV